VLKKTFSDSGLREVLVEAVHFLRHYASTAEMIRRLKEGALLRLPIEKLDEPEREQAWTEIKRQLSRLEGSDGIDMPGEFLIGVGTK
jgi:hypothetical protein